MITSVYYFLLMCYVLHVEICDKVAHLGNWLRLSLCSSKYTVGACITVHFDMFYSEKVLVMAPNN